ncbi:MAG: DUF1488 domain-containing protein [Rheinheimera sp.]|uniref:DUF1488 family protein n=1 Tax=Arsukibacterium sp. UBA3155 TaxID=1946058 RepID=UPI000C96C3FD|nr:DUF1488 family protein [Arsukibacterium sp. UBA3155]MAD73441.1 DUF1488 domain-containing protein [Rheinheimera sp.]|tara:strand:+ start:293859 stop:294095 length:237 start_codon:yes stop_codon:yes gene_type:complete
MNQQIIFNNDVYYDELRQAVGFSCLVAGLKVNCFIACPPNTEATVFVTKIKAEIFNWEDCAEQAIADDAFNNAGEIWL